MTKGGGSSGLDGDLSDLAKLLARSLFMSSNAAFYVSVAAPSRLRCVLIYCSFKEVKYYCARWKLLVLSLCVSKL